MPLLACSVAGDAISFDLASRGTALTLRLRDSFQPLTCGLSPASLAASAQRSHRHMFKDLFKKREKVCITTILRILNCPGSVSAA